MLNEAFQGQLRGLFVCLPGRVISFDASNQRAQIECAIQKLVNGEAVTISIINDVPVQFAGDPSWYHWHQITEGETEGLIHFSQRAIDSFKNSGGTTAPVDFRMFDASDAMFSPGYRSDPHVIPEFVNEGAGISSMDGSTRIHLTDGAITLTAGGQTLVLDGSGLHHNGTNIGDTHVHPQGNDSEGNSEQNTGNPQ